MFPARIPRKCVEPMMEKDMRSEQRYACSLPLEVVLHVGGGRGRVQGRSMDLSYRGIFVRTAQKVQPGLRVELSISGFGQTLVSSGVIVHALEGLGVGIQFSHPTAVFREGIGEVMKRAAARLEQITNGDEDQQKQKQDETHGVDPAFHSSIDGTPPDRFQS